MDTPDPDDFIALLGKCPRLEGVFLNGCKTLRPLGERIQQEMPWLTVVGCELGLRLGLRLGLGLG